MQEPTSVCVNNMLDNKLGTPAVFYYLRPMFVILPKNRADNTKRTRVAIKRPTPARTLLVQASKSRHDNDFHTRRPVGPRGLLYVRIGTCAKQKTIAKIGIK